MHFPSPTFSSPAQRLAALEKQLFHNMDSQQAAQKKKRIACLTSGGDSAGMNCFVRSVVRFGIARGCEVYTVYEGYEGLVSGGEFIKQMHWADVRGWISEGGTLIGSARNQEFRTRPGRLRAAKNLVIRGIDALVVCGGDGSLTGADIFRAEWQGLLRELVQQGELTEEQILPFLNLNIVGVVGSIDNDMSLTDATIGCYSSLAIICDALDKIDATASSHQRAFVVEVMGRHCGWLALMAGVSTGADYVFIPEKPPAEDWKFEMCETVKRHRALGKRKTIVIVAEGAHDKDLNKITSEMVRKVLAGEEKQYDIKLDTRVTTLGHLQRSWPVCAYDRSLATLQGVEAVNAVLEATPETPSPVIAINENKIVRVPLVEAVEATKAVTQAIENKDFDQAMKLRDTEFVEYYDLYRMTIGANPESFKLPMNKRMRVAIVNVGAPAGGMNSATRAVVAYCIARGHTPIAFHNGFPGLCRHHDDKPLGAVRDVTWLQAESWVSKGGSEIGTNRGLPSEDMKTTAFCFEHYKIDALFICGGFEGYAAVKELQEARAEFPSLRVPITLLPATISNNVPGTEYSIGSDTCLNALIQYCDTIRQSASASRRRVFVVETQGGRSGYIATMGGLAVGAYAVYTPEEGINLNMLARDIHHLKQEFGRDTGETRAGKLILRNETASSTYSTELIANMIRDEANGRFESRWGRPGHYLQGHTPSPIDRVRSSRLAVKCMQEMEHFAGQSRDTIAADPRSAGIIGIKGASVVFTPVTKLDAEETDWKNRTPKHAFWLRLNSVVEMLSGRPSDKDTGRIRSYSLS